MHTAHLRFTFPDPRSAAAVAAAVRVEADDGPNRTLTRIAVSGPEVTIDITGAELPGLRAALHSAVRLLDAADRSQSAFPQGL